MNSPETPSFVRLYSNLEIILTSTFVENFLLHLARGDSTNILGGWYLNTVRVPYPQVNILRPFLEVPKADLQEVCRSEGVEWIEDPSNQLDNNVHKNIRQIIRQNQEIVPGIAGLTKTCQETRRHLDHQGILQNFHLIYHIYSQKIWWGIKFGGLTVQVE